MKRFVYRVLDLEEWFNFKNKKVFYGNDLDQRSGYIHLSQKDQLRSNFKLFKNYLVQAIHDSPNHFIPHIFALNLSNLSHKKFTPIPGSLDATAFPFSIINGYVVYWSIGKLCTSNHPLDE